MNWMLTPEFVRKTQLEVDQIAARQIQQTLTPTKVDELLGYEVETFYKPLRDVGGDYFDVIVAWGPANALRGSGCVRKRHAGGAVGCKHTGSC